MKCWRIKLRHLPYKASTQHSELSLRPRDTTLEDNSQFSRRKQGSEEIKGPLTDHSAIGGRDMTGSITTFIRKQLSKFHPGFFGLLERAGFIRL